MFAEKLSPLISKFPQEAEVLRRVADYLKDMEDRKGDRVRDIRLDPNRLFDIAQAGSAARLARLIQILLDARIFERQIVVRCPSGNGIAFKSYSELPDIVRDPVQDIDLEVTQDNIEPSYVLVNHGLH